MSTVITQHYQQWCSSQMLHDLPARPDTVIFAYIPGQDENTEIEHTEQLPADTFIRHRMPVMQYGLLNPNVVAFSVILDTSVGDFDYNWIGLLHAESNTLCMISHVPHQQKIKTADGVQGNNLTRTFAMEFDGAAAAMQVTVTAEVWQIDFTARLAGMDEIRRLIARDHYGPAAFLEDAWRVTLQKGTAHIAPGVGYVQGLRVMLPTATTVPVQPGQTIWLDASWQGTTTGAWQTAVKLFADNRQTIDDYTDAAGFYHYLTSLATVTSHSATDLRPATPDKLQRDALKAHEKSRNHPDATLTGKGFVQLSDSISSSSSTKAATPWAVTRVYSEATRSASTSQAGRVRLSDSTNSTSTTQAATANAVKRAYDEATRSASTSQAGRVQLNDSTNSTSTTQAATAHAVKRTYDEATRSASINQAGRVQLNDSTNSISTTQAATANAVKRTYDIANRLASTSQAGRVQLNDTISSTSTTQAATANAVKRTYDIANRLASTSQAGRVQLNDTISSTSTTQAATANAVKRTYDIANRLASTNQAGRVQLNNSISSTSTTQAATANAVKRTYDEATRAASTNQAGRVQLNDSISSTSTTQAATANAVKRTYDEATRAASTNQAGRVQLNDSISSTSTTQAATANAVKRTYDEATRAASTNQAGRVQLNDSISSTSTTQAATPNAVKLAYDRASEALPVGTPCPWPSLNIPSGWVKCAGQSFSTSSYPDLARAYPNGRLPDLRGEFIRGYDDGRGVDSGRSLLTAQGDAIRNITGTVTGISETFSYSGSGSGVFRRTSSGPGADGTPRSVDWSDAGTLDFDVSRVAPTANENRPRNIAFLYIVRAA
ncbi:tail fiber protein [Edwardsiella tarda]|uniref:tail fiber protein n=1 Tax=Edwardsiella tarda TaxID=636 RepID=UPI003F657161